MIQMSLKAQDFITSQDILYTSDYTTRLQHLTAQGVNRLITASFHYVWDN